MATNGKEYSLHLLGVISALVAGAWLGAAEAPTKLVEAGLSAYAISLCMVVGVFVARWSFPTLIKGTDFIFCDLRRRKHLIVWALLAGGLWSVANTLTVIAIRDVGLSVAFPLWNANALVGLFWGRLFFGELKGAHLKTQLRVIAGSLAIVGSATLLGFGTIHAHAMGANAVQGVLAALGACVLWGTMYIPYRKAYISGMNPLSFVTTFTLGELFTVAVLAVRLGGGVQGLSRELHRAQHMLFWLFLGGFIWVIGDLFQQFAAKYLGIGRAIPMTSTNQLWGLVWAALVFHELRGAGHAQTALVAAGSCGMLLGALFLGSAVASGRENKSRDEAMFRECLRYQLDFPETLRLMNGLEPETRYRRSWWDLAIVLLSIAFFVSFALTAKLPPLSLERSWVLVLAAILLLSLAVGTWRLWRDTNFT